LPGNGSGTGNARRGWKHELFLSQVCTVYGTTL
jgi:hypothetical protein